MNNSKSWSDRADKGRLRLCLKCSCPDFPELTPNTTHQICSSPFCRSRTSASSLAENGRQLVVPSGPWATASPTKVVGMFVSLVVHTGTPWFFYVICIGHDSDNLILHLFFCLPPGLQRLSCPSTVVVVSISCSIASVYKWFIYES